MMPHNPWGSSARRPCARWHPPAIAGQFHSCWVLITFMLRQAQHERSRVLFTTRKFAFSLVMPLLNRSTGASQNATLTVRLERHKKPSSPFAWSLTIHQPYRSPGACRKVDGNSATRTHSLVLRQAQHERSHGLFTTRNFASSLVMPPTQPFDRSFTKSHPQRSPGASQSANLSVRLEPHDTPILPFALSLSKGGRELRNSHPFARTSTGSARTVSPTSPVH